MLCTTFIKCKVDVTVMAKSVGPADRLGRN